MVAKSRVKPRVLMLAHFPPPVHGAAAVSEAIRADPGMNAAFAITAVPIQLSDNLDQIGQLNVGKVKGVARMMGRAIRAYRATKPDIVYITMPPHGGGFYALLPLIAALRTLGARIIYHFHGKGIAQAAQSGMYRTLFRWAARQGSSILLSERLRPDSVGLVPDNRIYILPNFGPDPMQPAGEERQGDHILFLSNLVESKGPLVLLDALAILRTRGVSFRATFTGVPYPPLSAANFRESIAERHLADRVEYAGPIYGEDKWALFRSADIFAFPSTNDAFPLSVLEAMATGLAVVATAEGAIPDMVVDGVNGRLVPHRDPLALADALAGLLANPEACRRMGDDGRQRIARMFSRERFFAGMRDIWSDMLGRPPLSDGNA